MSAVKLFLFSLGHILLYMFLIIGMLIMLAGCGHDSSTPPATGTARILALQAQLEQQAVLIEGLEQTISSLEAVISNQADLALLGTLMAQLEAAQAQILDLEQQLWQAKCKHKPHKKECL